MGRARLLSLVVPALLACVPPAHAFVFDLPVRDVAHPHARAPAYLGDRLVVRLRPGAARLARPLRLAPSVPRSRLGLPGVDAAAARFAARLEPAFPGEPAPRAGGRDLGAYWLVRLSAGADLGAALDAFAAGAEVAGAEPVAVCPITGVPDDSLWSLEWQLDQPSGPDVHALEAWDVATGDPEVPVAVLDTGILRGHPDLGGADGGWGSLWTNPAEREGLPGVDDDGNGFVDDVWGWDFVTLSDSSAVVAGEDWRDPDDDPDDFAGHGTAVASLLGALTDNRIGIAGALWHTRVMALRVGWSSPDHPLGEVDMLSAAQALRYAARMGARVANCSFATTYSDALRDAALEAIDDGLVIVVAGGNNGSANYLEKLPEVTSVAATDRNDRVTLFSNRTADIDLAAPGVDMPVALVAHLAGDSLSMRTPTYVRGAAGTSFAAPLAAAGAALVQAARRAADLPALSPSGVQMRLAETSDDISALNPDGDYGAGRLNLFRALVDPPGSLAVRVGGLASGAPVIERSVRGRSRILTAFRDGRLVAHDPLSGRVLAECTLPAHAFGDLAAADLGGGRGNGIFVALEDGRIAGLDDALRSLPGWPVSATRIRVGGQGALALGDLDGDGTAEVAWGGDDGNAYAWRADGTLVPGFPRPVGSPGANPTLALADLDGAPGLELIVATYEGRVHALRADGAELAGWPARIDDPPTPPVVARTPSGRPLVVITAARTIYALDPAGAERSRYWLAGVATVPPAAGDLLGLGGDQLIIPTDYGLQMMAAGDAGLLHVTGTAWPESLLFNLARSPLIGPLLPTGAIGVLCPTFSVRGWTSYLAFDPSGFPLRFDRPGRPAMTPVLGDLDGDGRTDVVSAGGEDSVLAEFVLAPGSWRPDRAAWPTSRGNPARTGSRLGEPGLAEVDDAPPEAVGDLVATALDAHRVTLEWTAPRDTGVTGRAARYQIRFARGTLDPSSFASADSVANPPPPDRAGAAQRVTADGLAEGTRYALALRSIDPGGNPSPLSNVVVVETAQAPPGAVRDLRVAGGSDTSVTLRWTAAGDDGAIGRPARYQVRAAGSPLDEASFDQAPRAWTLEAEVAAGGAETRSLGGLARGEHLWFALRAVDAAGNLGPVSNPAGALVGPLAGRTGVALAASRNPTAVPVEIHWQGAAEALGREQVVRIHDLSGRRVRSLPVGRGESGVALWDGRDESGARLPAGLYFARLESGPFHGVARIVLLR